MHVYLQARLRYSRNDPNFAKMLTNFTARLHAPRRSGGYCTSPGHAAAGVSAWSCVRLALERTDRKRSQSRAKSRALASPSHKANLSVSFLGCQTEILAEISAKTKKKKREEKN